MSHPARKRTRARFGLTATHTGARGVSHPVSCLADILEVLLRAGFVLSTPGTPELCPTKYTLLVALCVQSAIWNLSNACRSMMSESVRVLSVTHGNPSLEEISLSDEQFWPIYPSLAEIPPVTDSTSDVCRDPSLMECTATRYCTVDLLWYQLQRSFSI